MDTTLKNKINSILSDNNKLKKEYSTLRIIITAANQIVLNLKCKILKIIYTPCIVFDPIRMSALLDKEINLQRLYVNVKNIGLKEKKNITDFLELIITNIES
ncbi:hypothetical protein PCK1_002918 [Pneumocystis canis]|nr:hypothetical protein PCK1_002918 [Pneumocystis canis]